MGKNTNLVFIDIPGINEAGTDNKYKEYVSKNWHLFDCVILVIDGKHDVRTDDQVYILELIKENLAKRNIPVIVLCNKIDYKTAEQEELIRIADEEVNRILVTAQSAYNESHQKRTKLNTIRGRSPVFISISAIQAYIYRLAPKMTLEKFKTTVDMTLIEEFGGELVGRVHWRKLSDAEKVEKVFDIVTDPENCKQGIDESQFEKFLQTLSDLLGGESIQRELIMDQVSVALKILGDGNESNVAFKLKAHYEKLRMLDGEEVKLSSTDCVRQTFWKVYQNLEDSLFHAFEGSWKEQNVILLVPLMDELISYHSLCIEAKWNDETQNAIQAMQDLVRRLINVVSTKEQIDLQLCKERTWYERSKAFSPIDWNFIKGSILLLSYDKYFIEVFGPEKIMLENTYPSWQIVSSLYAYNFCRICGNTTACASNGYGNNGCLRRHHQCYHTCSNCNIYFTSRIQNISCPSCDEDLDSNGSCLYCKFYVEYFGFDLQMSYDSSTRTMIPADATTYSKYVHVKIPSELSDPNHFGHIAWKYCQFMRSLGC